MASQGGNLQNASSPNPSSTTLNPSNWSPAAAAINATAAVYGRHQLRLRRQLWHRSGRSERRVYADVRAVSFQLRWLPGTSDPTPTLWKRVPTAARACAAAIPSLHTPPPFAFTPAHMPPDEHADAAASRMDAAAADAAARLHASQPARYPNTPPISTEQPERVFMGEVPRRYLSSSSSSSRFAEHLAVSESKV